MPKKEHQNPKGGLSAKGRAHYKRTESADLKPSVTAKQAKKSLADAARRKSFCARSQGWTGERGKAARKRWGC